MFPTSCSPPLQEEPSLASQGPVGREIPRSSLRRRFPSHHAIGGAAAVLVCLPVFVAAPLVRYSPWLSLAMTLGWLGLSWRLYSRPRTRIWGDLLYGFTLTWLAGSLYWGWLRFEPLWHMPVEALGIPIVWWGTRRRFARIGTWFYLGSLWGTAVTDLYIHSVGLLPEWRQAMQFDRLEQAVVPFRAALDKMATPWGLGWGIGLGLLLLGVGLWRVQGSRRLHHWAFAGAVLNTLLVDGLFGWGAALLR
ncbi:DUF3120 domain-containing protein [Synechococcus sp. RC10B2]|uniref:DUF3120 domain-containing protein n=1 Tax=Synechococcus sp. RC10B2 TaxID=2964530 RepID=UPI0039C74923